jgi:hypothetical protein
LGDDAQQWKQDSRATVCQKRHSLLCSWAQLNKANLKTHKLDAKLQDRHAAALIEEYATNAGTAKETSAVVVDWWTGGMKSLGGKCAGQAPS